MHLNFDEESRQKPERFARLGAWYILALGAIAIIAIIGQIVIQLHLKAQLSDSAVVNMAGKQRMLSQKIAKLALIVSDPRNSSARDSLLIELQYTADQWAKSQHELEHGTDSLPAKNSTAILELFDEIAPSFSQILDNTNQLTLQEKNAAGEADPVHLQAILKYEPVFLAYMDRIVAQYADEAHEKVVFLRTIEYGLLAITLVVICLEVVYIFRPTTKEVTQAVGKLIASENNARQLTKEIGALYTSLEKSYEQIAIVNQPVVNPVLFAKSDKHGKIIFNSGNMERLFGIQYKIEPYYLYDLFPSLKEPAIWLDEILAKLPAGSSWEGEVSFTGGNGHERWARVGITPVYSEGRIDELVMTGSDITGHKNAKSHLDTKNRAEIERTINQQKFRSVLILEGQEEERKRIAMDIHDGIGQMLTSLKYQIESIDLSDRGKSENKIREIGQLIKEVIREVRRVTFNIKPTVLGDYGLQAALKVFVTEIGKLTDIDLVFDTEGEIDRLPQKIEDNIFRIIQEAVNNAVKYSGASVIEVSLHQNNEVIVVSVHDEGKGFDTAILKGRSTSIESGRGFFNMYERTGYINGKLDIRSSTGEGTTVTLELPLQSVHATTQEVL
jgi:signal transduction histidine kinase